MAIAFVQAWTDQGKTAGSTMALPSGFATTVGSTFFLYVAFDNLTLTTPTVSSIGKHASETGSWAKVASFDSPQSGAAGGVRGELWRLDSAYAWSVSGQVVTFSGSVTAKTMIVYEYTGVGALDVQAGLASASTATPSVDPGQLLLHFGSAESATAPTLAPATAGHAWLSAPTTIATSGSSGATNVASAGTHGVSEGTGATVYSEGFEGGVVAGWTVSATAGTVVNGMSSGGSGVHSGAWSYRPSVSSTGGGGSIVTSVLTITGLTAGADYTYSAWVRSTTAGQSVRLGVTGVTSGPDVTPTSTYQQLSLSFTATSTSHELNVVLTVPSPLTTGHVTVDDILVTDHVITISATTATDAGHLYAIMDGAASGPEVTVNLSGSGALTAVGSAPAFAQAAGLSGSGTLSAVGVPTMTGFSATANLSGAGTLSSARVVGLSASAALSGSGALSAAGVVGLVRGASLSGSGTLGAAGVPSVTRTAALTGSGTLSASGTVTGVAYSGTAALSGSGALTAAGVVGLARAAALSGAGTLSAVGVVGTMAYSGSASLSGSGTLSATRGPVTVSRSVSLSGSGTLSVVPVVALTRAASLSGAGTLTAAGVVAVTRTASLSGSGALSAAGKAGLVRTASLTASGSLSAVAVPQALRTATLSGVGTLTVTGVARAGLGVTVGLKVDGAVVEYRAVAVKVDGAYRAIEAGYAKIDGELVELV